MKEIEQPLWLIMKQPAALVCLSLTELWERFGFYLVEGLLVIYMVFAFHFSDEKSYAVLGAFTALAYIAPVFGGFYADRVLGFKYAILLGAGLLFCGYSSLALSGATHAHAALYEQDNSLFLLALALITIGNGFLKPNISSFLGNFYGSHDPRRDAGFTIFYIGINLGVFLSTISSGFIQSSWGWPICFATGAIGMLIATCTFLYGYRTYGDQGYPPKQSTDILTIPWYTRKGAFILITLLMILAAYFALKHALLDKWFFLVGGVALFSYLFYFKRRLSKKSANRFLALLILILVSILFWSIFFQMFFSVNLFITRCVGRNIGDFHIPSVAFMSIEPLFIILAGFPVANLWQRLSKQKKNPSEALKFSYAFLFAGLSMTILSLGIRYQTITGVVQIAWPILFFVLLTIGEILLSPIGLAMTTKLAPPRLTGLMMGVWFLALGFGGELAGRFANIASLPMDADHFPRLAANQIYAHAFNTYSVIAYGTGIILFIFSSKINRLIRPPSTR